MAVLINGVELNDADMEREMPHHADADNPMKRAMTALVLKQVLLDEAKRLQLPVADEEEAIEALLRAEVKVPLPDTASCRRHYEQHPQRFTVGELVEADHILFQVTPKVPLALLRSLAEETLAELTANPALFAERAKALSNCPSGAVGGSLGQIARGDTVPEFEQALFSLKSGQMMPSLLETRFGLHIVRVVRYVEGRVLPFEMVEEAIGDALRAASEAAAWRQYLKLLVGKADITGVELEGADSPLVQ